MGKCHVCHKNAYSGYIIEGIQCCKESCKWAVEHFIDNDRQHGVCFNVTGGCCNFVFGRSCSIECEIAIEQHRKFQKKQERKRYMEKYPEKVKATFDKLNAWGKIRIKCDICDKELCQRSLKKHKAIYHCH